MTRSRKRKKNFYDGDAEDVLRGKENFKIRTCLPILDELYSELSRRVAAYNRVNDILVFLLCSHPLTMLK